MNTYRAIFGAYVRMYADHEFEAASDEAAAAQAIEEFKKEATGLSWTDADYDTLAQPSIVGLQNMDHGHDVPTGHDFAISAADARDYAAPELLARLKEVISKLDELEKIFDRARAAIREAETFS